MLYWHAGCFIEPTLCGRFDRSCFSVLHYARGTQMLLTNNFIVVKIDWVYYCNLAFWKGESLGGLQQIIQLGRLFSESNVCLMWWQVCFGENECSFLNIMRDSWKHIFMLCWIFLERDECLVPGPGLVSGVTMGRGLVSGQKCRQASASALPSLPDNILARPLWTGYWWLTSRNVISPL